MAITATALAATALAAMAMAAVAHDKKKGRGKNPEIIVTFTDSRPTDIIIPCVFFCDIKETIDINSNLLVFWVKLELGKVP
jgi:hypothetical protein